MSTRKRETNFTFEPGEPIDLGVQQEFVDYRAPMIMDELRQLLVDSKKFGVTVQGPYVTLRYGRGSRLVTVSMQVQSITDSLVREPPEEDK